MLHSVTNMGALRRSRVLTAVRLGGSHIIDPKRRKVWKSSVTDLAYTNSKVKAGTAENMSIPSVKDVTDFLIHEPPRHIRACMRHGCSSDRLEMVFLVM